MKNYLTILKNRLTNFWVGVKSSFWFIPLIIILFEVFLSFLLIFVEKSYYSSLPEDIWFYLSFSPESARSILTVIGTSMMTVAAIVFSITIVTLTTASSQFGPRLVKEFMEQKINQIVLGSYVGTFIFCIMALINIKVEAVEFTPSLATIVAICFAFLNIMLLVLFIHRTAISIQADTIISKLSHEFTEQLQKQFIEDERNVPQKGEAQLIKDLEEYEIKQTVQNTRSGYIINFNYDILKEQAVENNLVIKTLYRPGEYVLAGDGMLEVYSNEELEQNFLERLRGEVFLGDSRSSDQDVENALRKLVEVACRALSPGINDPFTAIDCINKIGGALRLALENRLPDDYLYDEQGRLRLVIKRVDFPGLLNTGFHQIRQFGANSPAVIIRMMEIIQHLYELAESRKDKNVLRDYATLVNKTGQKYFQLEEDKSDLKEIYNKIR